MYAMLSGKDARDLGTFLGQRLQQCPPREGEQWIYFWQNCHAKGEHLQFQKLLCDAPVGKAL